MIIVLDLIVIIIGLVMFRFSRPDDAFAKAIGLAMFWVGLLALLLTVGPYLGSFPSHHTFRIG